MHTVKTDNMYHGLVALCNVFVLLCRDTPSNHLFGGMAIASHGRAFDEVFSAALESQILPSQSPAPPFLIRQWISLAACEDRLVSPPPRSQIGTCDIIFV